MKVALITEGTSEYKSLPKIINQIRARTGKFVMLPMKASFQPDATAAVIARQTSPAVRLAQQLGADRVVLFIDREHQAAACGLIASQVESAIRSLHGAGGVETRVVIKNRVYENWLIADLASLRAQPKRFQVTPADVKAVEPGKADSVDALSLLKKMSVGPAYDKVPDSIRILGRYSVENAMRHSRSFRHFVHAIGDDSFLAGCRTPPVA